MNVRQTSAFVLRIAVVAIALSITNRTRCDAADANVTASGEAATVDPQSDVRWGGALQESFGYHRKADVNSAQKHPSIAPPGGWYGYGFPVKSYRWGWFGAEHYYPRVVWHRGYNGDQRRWAYRRAY